MNGSFYAEVRGVSKRFGGVQALSDIDLGIARGSIHALVGENGAGKSTLGKIIAGVHKPDDGELWVNGHRVAYRSARDALADGVTLIAQEPTLVPAPVGARERLPRRRGHGRGRRRAAQAACSGTSSSSPTAGSSCRPKKLARTLRVADQQKVEILRAIARDARFVIMDEPTSALTRDEAERLFELVRRLQASGTTIVYVSHFLAEVLALADTVTVLRDGKLVKTSAAAGETPESLVTAMLGRTLGLAFPEKEAPPADAPVVLSVRDLAIPPAVNGVSFELRAGEIVGLAGLIGSGRSEVARAIFGADIARRGTVEVAGEPLRLRSPRQAIGKGVVMLPEDRKGQGLLMLRSIVDNITLPHLAEVSELGVMRSRSANARASELVTRLRRAHPVAQGGGEHALGRQPAEGPLRQVAVSPARSSSSPTSRRGASTSGRRRAIYELIKSLAADGIAVLLISSEHEEVLGLAHRVLVMRSGRIVAEFDQANR